MSKTVSFMLGNNDKVYWYVSPDEIDASTQLSLDSVDYSPSGIRKIIQLRQNQVQQQWGNKEDLFIMIKPLPSSKLKTQLIYLMK